MIQYLENIQHKDSKNFFLIAGPCIIEGEDMALRERGIFSWLTGSGILKEEYLERDTNAIAAYGLNEGYVDIQVGSPEVTYQEDGIHIHFPVVEGTRYKVNQVEYAGDVIDADFEDVK